ncbi:MAG TPA: GAF domain-containing sensor histidine kinase, partial [Thermoanaerobaculia bacterium]|nr:GAF domain-containing sensor histidine kinase [Thermoanaerobaculia bacterium]
EYAERRRDDARTHVRRDMVQTAKQGSLAVPLVGRDGESIGFIELSDKYDGEFSAEDQDVMVQLAQLAATAIENGHLYDATRRANQAKDEFFAVLSHELRTPLTSILGWAQLCCDEASSELVRQALDSIENSARAQARLVDELLDVSRIMNEKLTIEREPVDLSAVVTEMLESVRPAAATRPVTLLSQVPPAIQVIGDAARLRQVVGNLLSNAVKFTPAGGLVETRLRAYNGEIILSVRDTGAGIDRSLLRAIFERYEQAATGRALGGLGLGLWIVRHIVNAHGGAIDASSEGPGRGSTFTVTLPST